jgi:hypothetical protein
MGGVRLALPCRHVGETGGGLGNADRSNDPAGIVGFRSMRVTELLPSPLIVASSRPLLLSTVISA